MADIYTFRCPGCGYEARVAGSPVVAALHYYETVVCKDCKELRDLAFAVRANDPERGESAGDQAGEPDDPVLDDLWAQYYREFEEARDEQRPVNVRLIDDLHTAILTQQAAAKLSGFKKLDPKCPKSGQHVWESWRHPGPCPKCGETMERGHWVPGIV